ncbi:hypothetical protein ACJRO7_016208 [Eucalyptus globulus]|uniref:Protein-S-isoprenylcysteine O-methyltransferase n=1 Tax=Eucalyptus globulus TaxID=34317 RepID=A0ABD3L733_EUCGL
MSWNITPMALRLSSQTRMCVPITVTKPAPLAGIILLQCCFLWWSNFPALEECWWISNLGFAMIIVGGIIRKLAIRTAGGAFTHLIKIHHEDHHKLIAHGVSIILCNPVLMFALPTLIWHLFATRSPYEELLPRQFFEQEYEGHEQTVLWGLHLWSEFCILRFQERV